MMSTATNSPGTARLHRARGEARGEAGDIRSSADRGQVWTATGVVGAELLAEPVPQLVALVEKTPVRLGVAKPERAGSSRSSVAS